MNEQLRAKVQLARWAAGEVPQSYGQRITFLYAKAFTFALDTIGKTLRTLGTLDGRLRRLPVPSTDSTARFRNWFTFVTRRTIRRTGGEANTVGASRSTFSRS